MHRELVGTYRRKLFHPIIAGGVRFPWLTEFYHRETLSKAVALLSVVIEHGEERGDIRPGAVGKHPEMLCGPDPAGRLLYVAFRPPCTLRGGRVRPRAHGIHTGCIVNKVDLPAPKQTVRSRPVPDIWYRSGIANGSPGFKGTDFSSTEQRISAVSCSHSCNRTAEVRGSIPLGSTTLQKARSDCRVQRIARDKDEALAA